MDLGNAERWALGPRGSSYHIIANPANLLPLFSLVLAPRGSSYHRESCQLVALVLLNVAAWWLFLSLRILLQTVRAKRACLRPGFTLKCSAGFSHGKGFGMRDKVAGLPGNLREAGQSLGIRVRALILRDFTLGWL